MRNTVKKDYEDILHEIDVELMRGYDTGFENRLIKILADLIQNSIHTKNEPDSNERLRKGLDYFVESYIASQQVDSMQALEIFPAYDLMILAAISSPNIARNNIYLEKRRDASNRLGHQIDATFVDFLNQKYLADKLVENQPSMATSEVIIRLKDDENYRTGNAPLNRDLIYFAKFLAQTVDEAHKKEVIFPSEFNHYVEKAVSKFTFPGKNNYHSSDIISDVSRSALNRIFYLGCIAPFECSEVLAKQLNLSSLYNSKKQ